ncbi:uncharacterized protein K460DRAFT_335433 [Cucurbitaria berberidis CBS 394.84]|uniref:Zn(2)-C6 fungal-type domain-containing protein n=1 Tax=Cucurbitaria berberidis CBS 394.84 TaxID=1168544 RepID=A0A9P4L761_9PLEO|nr:uncharacterized protein K460DRAFT_335433 [Cucurbitaria berberidis CBS 394.84]KAF1844580.1 hypothetical protein K460DRAFT_335433 [Cucurbitaria berberidis CBS 394.84]
MPASGEHERSSRKGQYSCDFCRARKLRCDRPLPCTSCKSRGKTCHFGNASAASKARGSTPISTVPTLQQQQHVVALPTPQSPQHSGPNLLAEIQALRKLTQDLEKRVIENTNDQQQHGHDGGGGVFLPPSTSSPESVSSPDGVGQTPLSNLGEVGEVMAHLERVSMSQHSPESVYVDDLVFKIERIRDIPQAPAYTARLGKPTPCIWLPHHAEARVLVDNYITQISYIQHIVHHPSLPATIDDVYRQIHGQQPVKPSSLILLLSIIASATHVWAPRDDIDSESSLFVSSAQAHAQTPLWIKATYAVLNATQNSAGLALQTIQGISILSLVLCNVEGVSLRYRSLISTGLFLGRELGLHRIDHESNAATSNTLQAEMGRRVWWILASKFGGPGQGVYQVHLLHMMVNKPRNINYVDLLPSGPQPELPISQPTDMSYFLQRIRLAEISRSMVDLAATSSGRPSYYAHITAMDFELDRMIQDIPPFLQLERYEGSPDSNKTSSVFIQAYMLNSMLHAQRCKLHLVYLTSKPNHNLAYATSRDTCLKSARQIIRGEVQLLRSQHSFVRVRLRLAAILHSTFMASIVLLMDACVNRRTSLEEEVLVGDLAEGLRIIQDARGYSLAAASLHESLMQILANHRAQQQQQGGTFPAASAATAAPVLYAESRMSSPTQAARDQPFQNLDGSMFLDNIQWDDLFSGVASSSFF